MNVNHPHEPLPPEERTVSGKVVILAILFLGVAGVIGSQFYYRSLQRRPVELGGQGVAQLMINSPHVTAIRLGSADEKPVGDAIESPKRRQAANRRFEQQLGIKMNLMRAGILPYPGESKIAARSRLAKMPAKIAASRPAAVKPNGGLRGSIATKRRR